jgi:hypothetical protein
MNGVGILPSTACSSHLRDAPPIWFSLTHNHLANAKSFDANYRLAGKGAYDE